jgi:hypothetical protein
MLRESGAAMNWFDIGHHLLALRPATSRTSRHGPETGCTASVLRGSPEALRDITHDQDRSQIRAGSGPGGPDEPVRGSVS